MSGAVAKMVAEHGLDGIVCIPRAQYDTLVTLLTKARHLLNKANTYTELSCGDCVRELDAALRAAGVEMGDDNA